jgi:asparagine synthase (glutamine-hydrolysing)
MDAHPVAYWTMHEVVTNGLRHPLDAAPDALMQTLDSQMRESIRMQMLADVPLGAFLSGGIDSSVVAALMQAQSTRPVKTFTIGFEEAGYDEAPHARAVARHLGTDHTELYVTGRQALDLVPHLPVLFDEPFADSSQLPTHLLAKLTRQHVTVALSGDGGDELFGGYGRYFLARSLWKRIGRLPGVLRRSVVAGLRSVPSGAWDIATRPIAGLLPPRHRAIGDRVHKLADVLRHDRPHDLYRHLISHWRNPAEVVIGASEPVTALTSSATWPSTNSFEQWMMYVDTVSYLPDDILVKVDRAAMAVALETRVPLLDHRLVELAWRLPLDVKMRASQGKWLLRQVLHRYVPPALVERPKMGFGIPLEQWLRGPLRGWAEELLDPSRLRREGYFHADLIRQKWAEHLSGQRNWHPALWNVLMFQAWLQQQSKQ